jgi:hypothetical protein
MKVLRHVMLIASIVAIPTLSFAQPMNTPMNDTATAPAVSMQHTQNNEAGIRYQQSSRNSSGYSDNSGYGAPGTGSSQSSAVHFVGKNSRLFDH